MLYSNHSFGITLLDIIWYFWRLPRDPRRSDMSGRSRPTGPRKLELLAICRWWLVYVLLIVVQISLSVSLCPSLHEMACYDLPAMIDQVLQTTGQQQLFYSGYSLGGTLFLMMASARPEYSDKVKAAFLLAPLVVRPSLDHLSPILRMTFEFMFAFVVRFLKINFINN